MDGILPQQHQAAHVGKISRMPQMMRNFNGFSLILLAFQLE